MEQSRKHLCSVVCIGLHRAVQRHSKRGSTRYNTRHTHTHTHTRARAHTHTLTLTSCISIVRVHCLNSTSSPCRSPQCIDVSHTRCPHRTHANASLLRWTRPFKQWCGRSRARSRTGTYRNSSPRAHQGHTFAAGATAKVGHSACSNPRTRSRTESSIQRCVNADVVTLLCVNADVVTLLRQC
jgi:hypothetical protein